MKDDPKSLPDGELDLSDAPSVACFTDIDKLVAIEEGAEWEVFVTENMTAKGEWSSPGGRSPLWYLKYGFQIRLKTSASKPVTNEKSALENDQ